MRTRVKRRDSPVAFKAGMRHADVSRHLHRRCAPGRGPDQLLHLGQGFPRLIAPLLRDVSVEQVFPEGVVPLEIDNHELPSPTSIDNELDAWDFLG